MGRQSRPKTLRLAEKLRYLREAAKLSQLQLSDILEVERVEITRYEKGTYEPPAIILLKYSRWAQVPLESLIDDELNIS